MREIEFKHTLTYDTKLKIVLKRHRLFDTSGSMTEKFYDKIKIKYFVK